MLTNSTLQAEVKAFLVFHWDLYFFVRQISCCGLDCYKVGTTTGPVRGVVTVIDNRLKSPIVWLHMKKL